MNASTVQLEPLRVEHAPMLFEALDDERVGRFIGGPDVTTLEALRSRIEQLNAGPPPASNHTWLNFAVLLDGIVVGRVEATLHSGIAEIAYLIGPEYWGRGLGMQAASGLMVEASRQGAKDFWATTAPGNHASVRVLERLGFTEILVPQGRVPQERVFPHPPLLSYDVGDRVFHRGDQVPRG